MCGLKCALRSVPGKKEKTVVEDFKSFIRKVFNPKMTISFDTHPNTVFKSEI